MVGNGVARSAAFGFVVGFVVVVAGSGDVVAVVALAAILFATSNNNNPSKFDNHANIIFERKTANVRFELKCIL